MSNVRPDPELCELLCAPELLRVAARVVRVADAGGMGLYVAYQPCDQESVSEVQSMRYLQKIIDAFYEPGKFWFVFKHHVIVTIEGDEFCARNPRCQQLTLGKRCD